MSTDDKPSRRKVLAALSAVPLTVMAGCSGGDDNQTDDGQDQDDGVTTDDDGQSDGGQQGERVPTVAMEFPSDMAGMSEIMENSAPFIQDDLGELGVEVELLPRPISEEVPDFLNDARSSHIWLVHSSSSPEQIDPREYLLRFTARNAGAGGFSMTQWANCEYTHLAFEQQSAMSTEERREIVTEALNIAAEEAVMVPITSRPNFKAANKERVDIGGLGQAGLGPLNVFSLLESEPTQTDTLRVFVNSAPDLERFNWTQLTSSQPFMVWNQMIYSPLLRYDENYELQKSLASAYTITDNASRYVVELADATFHNGEPVTAEDVKFTFNFLQDHHEQVHRAETIPLESITVVDESTVKFDFSDPYPIMETRELPAFGILYKNDWEAAVGNVAEFEPDTLYGSGPFAVENFQRGESLSLTPHDGHPRDDPDHNILLRGFQDQQTGIQAFENEELDIIIQLSPSAFDRLRDEDWVESTVGQGFFAGPGMYPQYPEPPIKFKAFREAMGKAINRQEINQVVNFNEADIQLHPIWFLTNHPWHPDGIRTYTDDPTGDIEAARQVLEDAGWSWDDDGNLLYPEDADTSPVWPAEETPNPDEFPCVDEEGNYVPRE